MLGKWLGRQWAAWLRGRRGARGAVLVLSAALLLFTSPSVSGTAHLLREADSLVARKEFGSALEKYSALHGLIPPSTIHVRMGNAYLQNRRWEDAQKRFDRALAIDPREAEAALGRGIVYLQRRDATRAIEMLAAARAAGRTDLGWSIDYHLGLAYLESRDFERAKEAFSRSISAPRGNRCREVASGLGLGLAHLPFDLAAANAQFVGILEADPSAPPGNARQGQGAATAGANLGDIESCDVSPLATVDAWTGMPRDIADVARVMRRVTDELIGSSSHTSNDTSNDTSSGMSKDEAYAAARLGHALLQADEVGLAVWFLEKALELRSEYVDAMAYLGFALWLSGRHQESMPLLEAAAQREPSMAAVRYFMGVALRSQGRLPEAIANLEAAIGFDPENAEARVELARALALQSRYVEARASLARAIQSRPESVELKLAAAWFHFDHLFDLERGLEIAVEAARLAPDDAAAQDAVGWGLYVNSRVSEAEGALRQAIASAPLAATPRFHLATILERRGELKAAAIEYRRTVDLDAGGSLAARAAAALAALQLD